MSMQQQTQQGADEMSARILPHRASRGDVAVWRRVLVNDNALLVGLALLTLVVHLLVAGN